MNWVLNLSLPLLAAALAFAAIVSAEGEANDFGLGPEGVCSTALTYDSMGFDSAIAVGPSGDVFVALQRGGCVIRIDSTGARRPVVGGGRRSEACPACGVRLSRPSDIDVAPDGTVYVLDAGDRLIAVAPGGAVTPLASRDSIGTYLRAFTRAPDGRLYVAGSDRVFRLDPAGPVVVAGGGGGDVGPGAPAASVRLWQVNDMAVGPGGNLYLAQEDRNRVLRVDALGTVTVFAGIGIDGDTGDGGPATKAAVTPAGLAVDDAGNLYISTQYSRKVRRVDPSGQITTIAGRGTSSIVGGGIGDGGPATQAGMGYPTSIAWHAGSLYILDEGFPSRIRRVDPAGVITTVAAGT